MSIIYKLRHKYDEPFRIRKGYGLSPIRNGRELKALIDFCEAELKEGYMKLNLAKQDVLTETIRLYRGSDLDQMHLHHYIDEHVGYYWS